MRYSCTNRSRARRPTRYSLRLSGLLPFPPMSRKQCSVETSTRLSSAATNLPDFLAEQFADVHRLRQR